jgi:hypothetical protein
VTLSANGTLSAEAVLGSAVIMRGVFASRPAAGTAGLIYFASDTGDGYRDHGATWDLIATTTAGAHDILSASHSDVNAGDTPADGDVLTWDDGASEWVAAPPPGAGTGAPTTSNYVTTTTDATLVNEKVLGRSFRSPPRCRVTSPGSIRGAPASTRQKAASTSWRQPTPARA